MDGSEVVSVRKQKRRKEVGNIRDDDIGIEKLDDDCIINILSRMSMKEACRTSVLSRRWRFLWTLVLGTTLEFSDWNERPDRKLDDIMSRKNFKRWVNAVLLDYQQKRIDALIIRFYNVRKLRRKSRSLKRWISYAIQQQVTRFELQVQPGQYRFPLLEDTFRFVKILRFTSVKFEDNVVANLLGSCPHLEDLCIRWSTVTKHILFGDPLPNLKALEITSCWNIISLELHAPNLVSFVSDQGFDLVMSDMCPSLTELTLGMHLPDSFVFEPHLHSSYSVRLVKLRLDIVVFDDWGGPDRLVAPRDLPQLSSLKRLELKVFSPVGRSLLFFASLIKASPVLREFRLEIEFQSYLDEELIEDLLYPDVCSADAVKIIHESLNVVELSGYIGCSSDNEFLCHLFKIAPTLERVVIDTQSVYYDKLHQALLGLKFSEEEYRHEYADFLKQEPGASTRIESKERAANFVASHNHLAKQINFLIK